MKKMQTLTVLTILLIPLLFSAIIVAEDDITNSTVISADQYDKGYRYNVQGWIYVHIEGDAYERGYQHGYLLSEEIIDMLNRWSNVIHNYKFIDRMGKRFSESRYKKVAETWWNFCTKQNTKMYWNKFPEEYQSEIEGIADGVTARGGQIHGRDVNYQDILAMNQMYEFMSKLTRMSMGVHPLRTFFHRLQRIAPEYSTTDASNFIETFLNGGEAHHCNGFIATGDATTEGQMVFSHTTISGGSTWWYTYYIALRWNVILDILPTEGHRVIISTSPGIIWSDEDYYQNDNGIVFLETTCPQGLFDNKGLPLSVRARTAVQYAESIDDVIYYLRYRNDGSMNAVWLIGDMKTGEICRFELGYSSYAVWRTFDGFYWSANNPIDRRVSMEKFYLRRWLPRFVLSVFLKKGGLGYNSIRYIPEPRDLKFEELGEKYYGEIDTEVVKEIMSSSPIPDWISDIKITDSQLLEQNGILAYFGNPTKPLEYINPETKEKEIERVYPTGWVKLFGLPEKEGFQLQTQAKDFGENARVVWEFKANESDNVYYSSGATADDLLHITDSSGKLYALDLKTGDLQWIEYLGERPTTPLIDEGLLFVGHAEGLSVFDVNGSSKWYTPIYDIVSNPIVVDDKVIFGDKIGNVYALSKSDGKEHWRMNYSDEIYISSSENDQIYLTSGKGCYALSSTDGKEVWAFDSEGTITSAPVFDDGTVYFASWDNNVYALNAKTGELRWKFEAGWGFDTTPIVVDGLVLAASMDNNVYALDVNNGSIEWIFSCNAAVHSQPVVYGDFVFFGSDDGRFYAVNMSTGKAEWFFAPSFTIDNSKYNYITTPVISDPVVSNSMAYIGINGTIYGLEAQTFEKPLAAFEESEIIAGTWLFLIIPLVLVILATVIYLYWDKKRVK